MQAKRTSVNLDPQIMADAKIAASAAWSEVPQTARLVLADGSVLKRRGKLQFTDARVSASTGTTEAQAEVPNAAQRDHALVGLLLALARAGHDRSPAIRQWDRSGDCHGCCLGCLRA